MLNQQLTEVRTIRKELFEITTTGRKSECLVCGSICPADEPKLRVEYGKGTYKFIKTAHLNCVDGGLILTPEDYKFGLGKSNEMMFECKNCGEELPEPEEHDYDDVVRIEKGINGQKTTLAWWFCDMDCFKEYVAEKIIKSIGIGAIVDKFGEEIIRKLNERGITVIKPIQVNVENPRWCKYCGESLEPEERENGICKMCQEEGKGSIIFQGNEGICKDCVCLVEREGVAFCDEVDKPISEVRKCPETGVVKNVQT